MKLFGSRRSLTDDSCFIFATQMFIWAASGVLTTTAAEVISLIMQGSCESGGWSRAAMGSWFYPNRDDLYTWFRWTNNADHLVPGGWAKAWRDARMGEQQRETSEGRSGTGERWWLWLEGWKQWGVRADLEEGVLGSGGNSARWLRDDHADGPKIQVS